MKIKLGVLLIGVKDLNKARPFYEEVFDVKTIEFRPPFMQGRLGEVELNIEENSPERFADWGQKNIGTRKSFSFNVDDIFEFMQRAKKAGAKIIYEPHLRPWGWYEGVIADPDGNEFVIDQEKK